MKETWRQQLRQKLADYEEPAPELSWEEVEKALDRQQPARAIPLWGRRIAAAVAFLLIGGGAWLYFSHREVEQLSAEQVAAVSGEKNHGDSSLDQGSAANQGPVTVTPRRQQKQTAMTAMQAIASESEAEPVEQQEASAATPADTTAAEVPTKEYQRSATQTQQTYTPYSIYTPKPSNSTRLLTAKLFYSNSMAGGQTLISSAPQNPSQSDPSILDNNNWEENNNPTTPTDNPTTPPDVPHDPIDETDTEDSDTDNEDSEEARTRLPMTTRNSSSDNADVQQSDQVSHHQPIRFGLLLRYQLSDRWALESGLTYTRLTADITRRVPGLATTSIDQSLNYIGIPLTASYLIYKSRHLGFYASGGLLVEKMVYGSRTEAGSRERVSIGPLQLSVNAGLGAEWRFIPALSLFVEPGLGYYFDNHSAVPTFYQEHPLSFNLNLGLRFSFE